MTSKTAELKFKISKCLESVRNIFEKSDQNALCRLNLFCLDFFKLCEGLQILLKEIHEADEDMECEEYVENIYLGLIQTISSIKYLETTIQSEQEHRCPILVSRQHFIERIVWNLNQMHSSVESLDQMQHNMQPKALEEMTFAQIMDMIWDQLAPFATYNDDYVINVSNHNDIYEEMMMACKQIRYLVDLIVGYTFSFANVALEDDKRPLSSLCQKVHRESISFYHECYNSHNCINKINIGNRRLKAISLDNALCQLEDYVNDALLRLIYHCFVDFETFSIKRLRKVISHSKNNHVESPAADIISADFDINIDRATQIGTFALSYAKNLKVKTHLRSCLVSLQSLDSCILPVLHASGNMNVIGSQLLEKHFNEEVATFKNCLHEILDGYIFAGCFYEMLHQVIFMTKYDYSVTQLVRIIKMAKIVCEHYHLKSNYEDLKKDLHCKGLFKKFVLMVNECEVILKHHANRIGPNRVLMRFKILRSTIRKFLDALKNDSKPNLNTNRHSAIKTTQSGLRDVFNTNKDFRESSPCASLPSASGLFYDCSNTQSSYKDSDSLKGNSSEFPGVVPVSLSLGKNEPISNLTNIKPQEMVIHRRDSLRIRLFKRQIANEMNGTDSDDASLAESIQISAILDQLSALSNSLATGNESKPLGAIPKR